MQTNDWCQNELLVLKSAGTGEYNSPNYSIIVRQTVFFSLSKLTSLEEENLQFKPALFC